MKSQTTFRVLKKGTLKIYDYLIYYITTLQLTIKVMKLITARTNS